MALTHAEPLTTPGSAPAVLLVTGDPGLLDELLRLAAAAGVIPEIAPDGDAATRIWATAGLVVVGSDLAEGLAERRPPRRDRVHVVSQGPAPDRLFRSAVALGAASVLELPAADGWLVDLLADTADGVVAPGLTVGVLAGSGGAGATTFACALALTAAQRADTLLVDADPLGGGADRVVGFEDEPGIRWDALAGAGGRLGSRSLRAALPRRGRLAVLGWPAQGRCGLEAGTAREVLSAAQRGNEVVVVDLPRRFDDVTAWLVAACDHLLLLARPDVPATAAAARVLGRVREVAPEPGLVVRHRGSALPAEELAAVLGLPLVATIAEHRRLAEWVDLGLGPVHRGRGPCAAAARTVLTQLRHW